MNKKKINNCEKEFNKRAIKSGVWYIINNLVTKGLGIITIPIFSRVLTQEEYGIVNNFQSWLSILIIVASLNLYGSIARAKMDYEKEIDDYISSILILSTISVLIFLMCTFLLQHKLTKVMGMDIKLIIYMYLYIIFSNAFEIVQSKYKAYMEYKNFTIISFFTAVVSIITSLILVNLMQEKYFARILGLTLPVMSVGIFMYYSVLKKSKKYVNFKYWKYALGFSLPLILHLLAGNVLAQFDRIAIATVSGFEDVALYGMGYNIATLLSIVLSSFNGAWIPWFYEKMEENKYDEIRKVSNYYIKAFMFIAILLLAVAPEVMVIMAPKNYYKSIYVIPPVILGIFFQFVYTLYANIEFYYKKTIYVPIGTVLSALINIILNMLLIPRYGYLVAAYTTLIGYLCLLLFHYLIVKILFETSIYNMKIVSEYIIVFTTITILYLYLYNLVIIRYIITILGVTLLVIIYKESIIEIIKKVKKW